MSVKITVELPDELAERARTVAAKTQRPVEDVLLDWLDQAGAEPAVEGLMDEQLLRLCDSQMKEAQQEEMSDLLARNRESQLVEPERERLDELMCSYRRGMVRKAQAIRTAVARGLRPPLE